jgi:hypothetical protein
MVAAHYRGRTMAKQGSRVWERGAVGLALVAAALHLGWEYTHGGIRSHHLLNRADLPAISNLWGVVVLPVLGWMAGSCVMRRAAARPEAVRYALTALAGALAVGVALSAVFVTGNEAAAGVLFLGVLLSGLVFPTYRAEYTFGFVLGMTFVFGSVLPTLVALVAAAISASAHLLAWPAVMWGIRRVRG